MGGGGWWRPLPPYWWVGGDPFPARVSFPCPPRASFVPFSAHPMPISPSRPGRPGPGGLRGRAALRLQDGRLRLRGGPAGGVRLRGERVGPGQHRQAVPGARPPPPRHSECGLGPRNDLPPSHMGRKGFVSCPGGPKADQSAQSLFVLESKEA